MGCSGNMKKMKSGGKVKNCYAEGGLTGLASGAMAGGLGSALKGKGMKPAGDSKKMKRGGMSRGR